ncbi:SpoIVB peptidase [Clostridium sp. JN-9]|uniref:SpoIVB peptidase n=1 Tax=Clostridium sp. JN-9 TaxID=2507159 RepID=UPI000FFE0B23|nr:SpoIVB peptidase [Clostridium sp. JN-9]QAT40067.1 SpoIVB peptidase [Clostridium sp. JN-9]
MNNKHKKILLSIISPILLFSMVALYNIENIPATIFIREGNEIKSNCFINLKQSTISGISGKKFDISFLGIIPVKSVSVKAVDNRISVYPGGVPVGVKLNTKGALVVGLCDIESNNGKVSSPGAVSGIQIGDSIIKVNGQEINSAEDVSREINANSTKGAKVEILRKGTIITKEITPVKSLKDNSYKIGLWVRDSTAGVGTLTFYDRNSGMFAALGHPITDVDTGTILSVNNGEIVKSSILSVRKGEKGSPGELKGIFVDEDNSLGKIYKNTQCGVFGKSNGKIINRKFNKPMEIALRNEIKTGPAQIITTINGEESEMYDIVIEKLLTQEEPGPKSMIIRVTDPKLLEKTGGIVQGMSGSPIIQNNKIVGAVTHVLINKPDTGYGIYIEWMLKDSNTIKN